MLKIFADEQAPHRETEYSHYFFQGLLVEMGNLQGFRTFIPAQDKNKPFGQRKLGDVASVEQLFEFTYKQVLRRALTIDVTWLNERKYPDSFFEVEHSTDIYNSLLKFTEFQDFRTKFYIVADGRRRAEFDDKLALNAFQPIRPSVHFWDYGLLAELHSRVSQTALLQKAMG